MKADVCMIVEGSYPYVVGGVSTWVHDLMTNLKEISFAVVYIGVTRKHKENPKYVMPKNVVDYREIHLLDPVQNLGPTLKQQQKKKAWAELELFLNELSANNWLRFESVLRLLRPGRSSPLTPHDLLYSKKYWELIVRIYEKYFPHFSFIDYFWNCRFMIYPFLKIIYSDFPEASVYHATCTGYAGLYGVLAKINTGSGFVLTEHGIYTNERMIEITQAQWIYREKPVSIVPSTQLGMLQNLWMEKFSLLSRLSYNFADQILTLFEGNRLMQLSGGADEKKTKIIPNGVDLERFNRIYELRKGRDTGRKVVALAGRVAPIKDVKTFIRACRIVREEFPESEFYVLGPHEESEAYFEECQRLVRVLGLGRNFHFPGNVDMDEFYKFIDVLVLTSISEAQPYVVLEAMGIGIPVVATNVGACPELLLGRQGEELESGRTDAGIITNINSPRETAEAIIRILNDRFLSVRMGEVGRERVAKYYQKKQMLNGYRNVYMPYITSRLR